MGKPVEDTKFIDRKWIAVDIEGVKGALHEVAAALKWQHL